MSYRMKIDPKSRKAAKFISRLQKKIQAALVQSGKTQQEVADILGVDRSVVNRRLKGSANLTARSIAEFAHAFDKEVEISFVEKKVSQDKNWHTTNKNIVEMQSFIQTKSTGTLVKENHYNLESTAL